MPELPEVEIAARRLDAAAGGLAVESALAPGMVAMKTFDPPLDSLAGMAVSGVRRVGKMPVVEFEGDGGPLALLVHMMSAGRLQLFDKRASLRDKASRVLIRLSEGHELRLREFGTKQRAWAALLPAAGVAEHEMVASLGPEAWPPPPAEELDKLTVEGLWRSAVPAEVAFISGDARGILAGERVALNLLGHLSGVATLTARYAEAIRAAGGGATLLDTRKTTPGLRALEKQAVLAGGGQNHRRGLDDAILIKENHITLAGGLEVAVERARESGLPVEVECRDEDEVRAALASGAERLLLDNMSPDELRACVAIRDDAGSGAELEASGGVTLENIGEIGATGVDFVSVGALTHSAPQLDVSMLLEPA